MTASAAPCVIWRLLDGKPGHESQSLGLLRAFEALLHERPVHCFDIPVRHTPVSFFDWLLKRYAPGRNLPRPDYLIAAGHATHVSLLCARRAYGGQSLLLMKPSLPARCFDWVIAPAHDDARGANVIVTKGVLNAMRPGVKRDGSAIMLIGGESKHFVWSNSHVLAQVDAINTAYPNALITDSRRTPLALRELLASRFGERYLPWETCPPGWLATQLAETAVAWVSEDSVSMIYEALSAGCALGLIGLALPKHGAGRLVRGIQCLEKVVRFDDWQAGRTTLLAPQTALQEATRVAALILDSVNDH